MTAAEYWDASPREIQALAQIHTNSMELDAERFATIAAALYNQTYPRKDEKMWTREEFGAKPPQPLPEKDAWKRMYPQTGDEQKAMMAKFFGVSTKNGS